MQIGLTQAKSLLVHKQHSFHVINGPLKSSRGGVVATCASERAAQSIGASTFGPQFGNLAANVLDVIACGESLLMPVYGDAFRGRVRPAMPGTGP